jgi:hypothetical protein
MCLSQEAYQKRLWGVLEELCDILSDKPLPPLYEKRTSADIGIRTHIGFSGELSILLEAYADEIIATAEQSTQLGEQLANELNHAASGFVDMSEHFAKAGRDADLLSNKAREIAFKNRQKT